MLELLIAAFALLSVSSSRDGQRESKRRFDALSSSDGISRKTTSSAVLAALPDNAPPDLDPSVLARVSSMSPSELYDQVVDLIVNHIGRWTALGNKHVLEEQYDKYRTTVRSEGSFGPRSRAEVDEGIALIERLGERTLSADDRQMMLAVGFVRVPLILRGEE